jgi:hypothetical protein
MEASTPPPIRELSKQAHTVIWLGLRALKEEKLGNLQEAARHYREAQDELALYDKSASFIVKWGQDMRPLLKCGRPS